MMTAARSHEAKAEWARAAACYRELVYLQSSSEEARYRHAWVSRQAATSLDDRKQAFFQLEAILERAPFHLAALRTHLDLALELDMAAAALTSAERLYSIDRHEATTLQMCFEAMLRFSPNSSGLPAISVESLSELAEKSGPVSQWRDNLVIEVAAFCCNHSDSVDSRLTSAVASAVRKAAHQLDSCKLISNYGILTTSLEKEQPRLSSPARASTPIAQSTWHTGFTWNQPKKRGLARSLTRRNNS